MLEKINNYIPINLKGKYFLVFSLSVFILFQLFIAIYAQPYSESQTIISWFYSPMGIFDTLAMRIAEDNTIKGTYSFIYLLPSYCIFIASKFLMLPDNVALIISNLIIINLQFILLLFVARKLNLNTKIASVIYIAFFLTTYMWSGIIRIFPHDILIILALLHFIFPRIKFFLKVVMIYVDPVIGSLFTVFYYSLNSPDPFRNISINFLSNFTKILSSITFGFLIWLLPILYLENILGYEVTRGSIFLRIFGEGDEYFFSRLQVYSPLHYYLPNPISTLFPSIYFAVAFGASNLISPAGVIILYQARDRIREIINLQDSLLFYGICFMMSYVCFALIFGQAAASHRFDYDQYFQIGLIFALVNLISKQRDIIQSLIFKTAMIYSYFIIFPILLIMLLQ